MEVTDLTQKSEGKCFPMARESLSFSNETNNCQGETSQTLHQPFGSDQNKTDSSNHSPKQLNQRAITTVADQERVTIQPTTSNGSLATDDVILLHSMESWDPLCHDYFYIDAHDSTMRTATLPHDLKFVEKSELLPMAYDDFTKYVKEDLCWSLSENSTVLTDDDCVVPSLSPAFQDAKNHYLDSCSSLSQTSSDWSQEYAAMDIECKKKGKSHSPAYGSTYGTLNWGLSPTIIYKTPGPETSVDIGNVPMRCSITEGNIELITPPQANLSKLRQCCRRISKVQRSRKRLLFDDSTRGINDEGVQEVPTNDNQEMDGNPVSDHVPEDPMWFEEENEWDDCEKQENSRMYEEDLGECYTNLRNILPKNTEATSKKQVLSVAVEHIKELQKKINDINQVKSPDKLIDFQGPEDVFGVLPEFSWSDIDEPSYEIQAILENLVPSTNAAVELDQSPTPPHGKKDAPKKKRKCRKTARQKRTKKPKKATREKREPTEMNTSKFAVANDAFTPENLQEMRNNYSNNTTSGSKPGSTLEFAVISGENSQFTSPSPTACTKGNSVTPSMELLSPQSSYYPITGLIPLQTIGKPLILPKPLMATPFSPPFTSCNTASTSGNMAVTSGDVLVTSGDMLVTSGYISSSGYISPSGSPLLTTGFQLIAPRMSIPDSSPSPSFPASPLTRGSISLVTSGGIPLARNMMANTPLTWFQSSPVQLVSSQELWDSPDSEGRHERNEKVKRKSNGYMLYCKKKRPSLFMEYPELKSKPGDITRLLSENWKNLTEEEKSPYIEEAMKEAMNSEWIEWTNDMPY